MESIEFQDGDNDSIIRAILDSGATVTIGGHRYLFLDLVPCYVIVVCANGNNMIAYWKGTMVVNEDSKRLRLPNSLFIPGCATLISASQITNTLKLKILLEDDGASLYRSIPDIVNDKPVLKTGKRISDKLWRMELSRVKQRPKQSTKAFAGYLSKLSVDTDPDVLHRRYGHISMVYLKKMFPFLKNHQSTKLCDACCAHAPRNAYRKSYKKDADGNIVNLVKDSTLVRLFREPETVSHVKQVKFTMETTACENIVSGEENKHEINNVNDEIGTKGFGRYFASDTKHCSVESIRGYKYLFIVVDIDTRVCMGFLGAHVDDFYPAIKTWLLNFYNKYQRLPSLWKFDQGGEFLNHEILKLFKKLGIIPKYSTTKQSNQNAHSESKFRVIWSTMLKMLAASGVPMPFWCYAVMYAIFILNHVPHRALNFKSPLDVAKFKRHDCLLHALGSAVWYTDITGDPKSTKLFRRRGILLGLSDLFMGYDILDIETGKVVQSRNIISDETCFPFLNALQPCKIQLEFGTWPSLFKTEKVSINVPDGVDEQGESKPKQVVHQPPSAITNTYKLLPPDIPELPPMIPFLPQLTPTVPQHLQAKTQAVPQLLQAKPQDLPETSIPPPTLPEPPFPDTPPSLPKCPLPVIEPIIYPTTPTIDPSTNVHDIDIDIPLRPKELTLEETISPIHNSTLQTPDKWSTNFWPIDTQHEVNNKTIPGNNTIELPIHSDNRLDKVVDEGFKRVKIKDITMDEPEQIPFKNDDAIELLIDNLKNENFAKQPIKVDPSKKQTKETVKSKRKDGKNIPKKFFFDVGEDTDGKVPIPRQFSEGNRASLKEANYEVEDILDMRIINGKTDYLVKWKSSHGNVWDEPTWQPARNCASARYFVERARGRYFKDILDKKTLQDTKMKLPPIIHRHNTRSRAARHLETIDENSANMITSDGKMKEKTKGRKAKRPSRKARRKRRKYFGYVPFTATEEEEADYVKAEEAYFTKPTNQASNGNDPESQTPGYQYDSDGKEFVKRERLPKPSTDHSNWHYLRHQPSIEECMHLAHDDIINHIEGDDDTLTAPKTRNMMLKDDHADEYIQAELVELAGIHKHGTFKSVIAPPGVTPITCRWVYDIKRNKDGSIEKFKARLVVHGYKQVAGIDFNKTFSSTTQIRTFRFLLALSTELDLDITQYDVSNAFLNGFLEEPVFMEYPPGYKPEEKDRVVKLIKALYGLKQASRVWQETLYSCLKQLNLVPCKSESGVLHCRSPDGKICIVFCWVDDLGICCNDKAFKERVIKVLNESFILKSLGELSHYVGIVVDKEKDGYSLHQGPYNSRMIKKYLDEVVRSAKVPANPNERLSVEDCPSENGAKPDYPYINATGSLLYSAICTRPDIFYAVMQLARFNSNPGETHVKASKQVLRYLNDDPSKGIKYTKTKDFDGKIRIIAYVDSDWAGCVDTRRSTMGYIIKVANGPTSWKSKTIKSLALSSCEAEFVALSEVCRELMWMCRFLDELGIQYHTPEIHCDSSSAIRWAEDPVQHQRNKHVELKYYYCRDLVTADKVRVFKVHTTLNCADIMTKPVGKQILDKLLPTAMGQTIIELQRS
jgi:hypothetical protein